MVFFHYYQSFFSNQAHKVEHFLNSVFLLRFSGRGAGRPIRLVLIKENARKRAATRVIVYLLLFLVADHFSQALRHFLYLFFILFFSLSGRLATVIGFIATRMKLTGNRIVATTIP